MQGLAPPSGVVSDAAELQCIKDPNFTVKGLRFRVQGSVLHRIAGKMGKPVETFGQNVSVKRFAQNVSLKLSLKTYWQPNP